MDSFEKVSEQPEAKRLLRAALDDALAHAYLFHGPPGVGKRALAKAFATKLLGDEARVERGSHPDLYVLEPLGDQIRIDAIRELRHDLHMRPFEADRRVYLIFGAHSMNEEAADALLKDLEEPPSYAVIVLGWTVRRCSSTTRPPSAVPSGSSSPARSTSRPSSTPQPRRS